MDNIARRPEIFDNSIRDEILTPPELAARLKISVSGLRKIVTREALPYFKVGQQLRFSWQAVASHLAKGANDGAS